jgi:preprotein translocase subunit SecY
MKDPNNYQYDEQVQITSRLRTQDISTAKIILNLSTKTVDKNSFNELKKFNELFKYFFKGYHKYITEVMIKLDAEYFNNMLDEMQTELDNEKVQVE